jgi:hypothetical protein
MTKPRGVHQKHRSNKSVERNPGSRGKKRLIAHEIAQGIKTHRLNENHVPAKNCHCQQSREVRQEQSENSQKQGALF